MSDIIQSTLRKEDVFVLSLQGNLEVGKKARLKEELLAKIPFGTKEIVLDFEGVEFIDSACLGALIGLVRTLREKGGDIRLASLHEDVQSIFQITRLDKVFKIFDKQNDAINSYTS